ncbi:hypothetical protein ACWEQC_38780 [Streptomyces shenzhenensis]
MSVRPHAVPGPARQLAVLAAALLALLTTAFAPADARPGPGDAAPVTASAIADGHEDRAVHHDEGVRPGAAVHRFDTGPRADENHYAVGAARAGTRDEQRAERPGPPGHQAATAAATAALPVPAAARAPWYAAVPSPSGTDATRQRGRAPPPPAGF